MVRLVVCEREREKRGAGVVIYNPIDPVAS